MSKRKILQEGGVIDEDALFNDDDMAVAGEEGALPGAPPENPDDDALPEGYVAPEGTEGAGGEDELTGVEQFLTHFGVNGGIITYEDGTSARFSELDGAEQSTILSSLTKDAVPSTEDRYNLDDREVNLLNAVRESGDSPEEFINSIIDSRVSTLMSQNELGVLDYSEVSDDAIFIKSLRDNKEDISNDEIASELVKAKELTSFSTTVDAIREMYKGKQRESNSARSAEEAGVFNEELEQQRHSVVEAVEDITDIGGAPITTEMKEFLLHDIMELNENKDPILMENIFSSPEKMFKANWFATYGEDYMKQTNEYWKKEVSKAHKAGYQQATGTMPGAPTIVSPTGRTAAPNKGQVAEGQSFGEVLSEEELFDESRK